MKKINIVFAAALAMLAACQEIEVAEPSAAAEELHASIEDLSASKTALNDNNGIYWCEGDQIVVFLKNTAGVKYQVTPESAGNTNATFTKVQEENNGENQEENTGDSKEAAEFAHNIAYYPYSSSVACSMSEAKSMLDVYALDVNIPELQTYTKDSFGPGSFPMISVSENDNIPFKNICGAIKLQLKGGQKVTSIRLEGKNNEKIAGPAVVKASIPNIAPSITMSDDAATSITLNCENGVQLNEEATEEFIISLPPTDFSKGFIVTVTDSGSQTYVIEAEKQNSVMRSALLVMPAVDLNNFKEDVTIEPEEKEGYNVYGLVSCDGAGVPGVVISDGVDVAVTDKYGVYYLKSEEANRIVFMSVPSGYEVEADGVLPMFYQILDGKTSTTERADWTLTKVDNQDHIMYVMGDMHLANRTNDLKQFATFTSDLSEQISLNSNKRQYGLTLGDMTWDKYWYDNSYDLNHYKLTINSSLSNIQIFHTIGNHDHEMNKSGDFNTVTLYKNVLAPTYYSFNIGDIHYVVLDDILCTNNGSGDRTYDKKFTTDQLNWLKKDLEFVDQSKPLVIAMHAQIYSESGASYLENSGELEEIVRGYTTHILSAHTHLIYNNDKTAINGIYHHNSGAVCGAWWWSGYYNEKLNLCKDGSPAGYYIYNMNGNDVKWRLKPTGMGTDHSFRTYDRNSIELTAAKYIPKANASNAKAFETSAADWVKPSNENYVYFNVYDYDPSWKIEVKENGRTLAYELVSIKDPLDILAYEGMRYNANKSITADFCAKKISSHIFRVKASSATSTLEFTVTDRFGVQSQETMRRPKAFNINTYIGSKHPVSGEDSNVNKGE